MLTEAVPPTILYTWKSKLHLTRECNTANCQQHDVHCRPPWSTIATWHNITWHLTTSKVSVLILFGLKHFLFFNSIWGNEMSPRFHNAPIFKNLILSSIKSLIVATWFRSGHIAVSSCTPGNSLNPLHRKISQQPHKGTLIYKLSLFPRKNQVK